MQVYKYWRRLDKLAKDSQGREWDLRAWGGSLSSEEEAERNAEAKLDRWIAKLARGDVLGDYEYQLREIREELVEEIHDPAGNLIGAITRNRYGALVLNAASVLIADLDAEQPNFITKLLGWFGRKPRDKESLQAAVRELVTAHPGFHAILYETHAGLRAFFTHADFDPTGDESHRILTTLGSDRLYQKLCTAQQCYRARLTPKPWRCSHARPPRNFPRTSDAQREAFELWLQQYDKQSTEFAVCRRIDEFGSGQMTAEAQTLLEIHDRFTLNAHGRRLA